MSKPIGGASRPRKIALLQSNMDGFLEAKIASKELIGVNELAEYLGISTTSVYRMVERRSIPFFRLARHLRFRRSDIEWYLAKCFVKPLDEYECTKVQKGVVG